NLRQPFKRRPSPQKAQFGKLIWLAAIAQNEAGASSATSGRCVLPGNAPLILRRRSANENGENCSDRSSQLSRCYNRGLLQQTASSPRTLSGPRVTCHDLNEPKCVAIMPQLFRSLHIMVDQLRRKTTGGNSLCMCVVNVARSQERCWASSASPLPCYGVALPRPRLGSIFSAAGLAYSRPASTASPKS